MVVVAQRRKAGDLLVLQGNVEVRQVNLGFKVAGRIKQIFVDEEDSVVEGQTLASLDKVYFEESLAQVRAQREQSAASLAKMEAGNRPEEIAQIEALVAEREAIVTNTKVTLDRAKQLLKTSTGTQKTYDDALAANWQAEAQLNSSRQALRLMNIGFRKEDIDAARGQLAERDALLQVTQRQLTDADLKAPSAGVVLSRVREAGAIVNVGETVYVLSLTTPVWVRTYVSEVDLGRISPGMDVEIKTDTPNVKPRKGRIGFISPTAEFTPKTVETRASEPRSSTACASSPKTPMVYCGKACPSPLPCCRRRTPARSQAQPNDAAARHHRWHDQALCGRRAACARWADDSDQGRPGDRAGRSGWSRKNNADAPDGGLADAKRGKSHGLRVQYQDRDGGDPRNHRLHAAALRLVRGPVGHRKLTLYADLRGVTGKARIETFEKLLAFTDLARFTDRLAGALSGGMKQKLGLACAMLRSPDAALAR